LNNVISDPRILGDDPCSCAFPAGIRDYGFVIKEDAEFNDPEKNYQEQREDYGKFYDSNPSFVSQQFHVIPPSYGYLSLTFVFPINLELKSLLTSLC
jgi:hypothetical protein